MSRLSDSRLSGGFSFAATRNDHLRARALHRDTLDPCQSSLLWPCVNGISVVRHCRRQSNNEVGARIRAADRKTKHPFCCFDDTGYGDLGPYGGGEGRGMPTPSIDRMAEEGMTFFSFYAQPSCTPGRAAMQTGRIPEPQRHDHGGVPGPGRRIAGSRVDTRLGAEAGRLQDLLHRQMASRRGRLRAAQRPGLRRDEICRPLSPERLHLRRSDLVPGHGPGTARHVSAR